MDFIRAREMFMQIWGETDYSNNCIKPRERDEEVALEPRSAHCREPDMFSAKRGLARRNCRLLHFNLPGGTSCRFG